VNRTSAYAKANDRNNIPCLLVKMTLCVRYPDDYPDVLPQLSLKAPNDNMDDSELNSLLQELLAVGNENLGMAMTFTLVSHLREQLSRFVRARVEKQNRERMEKERRELEEEETRTRGTPVAPETFKAWKVKFDAELALKKNQEDEDKLKGLTPKEREEWKRLGTRLTGRQLFERHRGLEEDSLMEEGTVSVDFSQYDRTKVEEEEEDHVTFSDSD